MNDPQLAERQIEPYPWSTAQRLEERKPYSFAPFGGEAFLRAWTHSRGAFVETLRARGAVEAAETSGIEQLSRDAASTHPDRLAALANRMDALQRKWQAEVEDGPGAGTAETIEAILSPYLAAGAPLRPRADGPAWAHATLVRLLERFEAFGCVHATYDANWRKRESSPNRPGVCVRLALAAAWLSWSELIVDPPASIAHLNVLLKLNDLVEAGVHHGDWPLDRRELRWALASVQMEDRLVSHWRRSRGTVH